ncbi:APC family permease [Candidatus Bathyarchaeota archaeon]|nr:APC family permease [Candidatus Bathyarchaeota archaeon]
MSEEKPLLFVRKASGLSREIGPWSVLFFPLKASLNPWFFLMIGILPFLYPGVNMVLSFALAGILVIIYGLVLAFELVCMPRAGGNYVVIARGLHPVYGMMEGWRSVIWNPIANATCSFLAASSFADGLKAIGIFTGSRGLIDAGSYFATVQGSLIIAIILIIVGGLIDFFGPGTLKRSMVIFSGITIIGTLVMIAILVATGPNGTPSMWDAVWGKGAYNEILNVARANGWKPASFSWASTSAAILTCRGFLYPDNVSPLAGEMSKPRKTIMVGIGFAGVILAAFAMGASASLMYAFGDFVSAYDYVVMGGYASQLTINPGLGPNLAIFAASLTTNAALSGFMLMIPFFSIIGLIPHGYFWTTRPFFAMALDRYAPKIFSHVSDRWHIPIYSWLYCFVMQLIFVFLAATFPIILSVSLFILGTMLVIWWSITGVTLPFTRPHIWERGVYVPLPLMISLSLISTILEYYVLFTGVATVNLLSIVITLIIMAWGIGMYAVMSYINKKRGIDINAIFAEVPPE